MAINIKTLLQNFRAKINEKLNDLDGRIKNISTGGISADVGNDIVQGTDSLPYFKERTAAEIGNTYEALTDVNRFSDSYKLTVDTLGSNLTGKADLDPATGKIYPAQIP